MSTDIDPDALHRPAGTSSCDGDPVVVLPEDAGWRYTALRVIELAAGEQRVIEASDFELAVLPMSGSVRVDADGCSYDLAGRASVFERVTDFCYLPRDTRAVLHAEDACTVALPMARARRRCEPRYVAAQDVSVEVRGAGRASRQVTNFLAPGAVETDRLVAVEVVTPPGNWSSHPPHKHDAESATEAQLEEIYLFRIAGEHGWGVHRTYDLEQGWDVTVPVRSDDVFLVPRGYHGPCMASPEHAMWYLNVLAGPGAAPSLAFSDDPQHAWIRSSWDAQDSDPRVPLYTAAGPRIPTMEAAP